MIPTLVKDCLLKIKDDSDWLFKLDTDENSEDLSLVAHITDAIKENVEMILEHLGG